jgi:hypothetical protein
MPLSNVCCAKLDGVIVGRKTSVTPFTYAFVVRANEELIGATPA